MANRNRNPHYDMMSDPLAVMLGCYGRSLEELSADITADTIANFRKHASIQSIERLEVAWTKHVQPKDNAFAHGIRVMHGFVDQWERAGGEGRRAYDREIRYLGGVLSRHMVSALARMVKVETEGEEDALNPDAILGADTAPPTDLLALHNEFLAIWLDTPWFAVRMRPGFRHGLAPRTAMITGENTSAIPLPADGSRPWESPEILARIERAAAHAIMFIDMPLPGPTMTEKWARWLFLTLPTMEEMHPGDTDDEVVTIRDALRRSAIVFLRMKAIRDNRETYMPAVWFTTQFSIDKSRMLKTPEHKLRRKRIGNRMHFSVADAMKLWPEDVLWGPTAENRGNDR